ncbi:MAG TPA: hypothetical protein PLI97_09965 [Fluviicola sp.]|nr:hypothetical protein [Fluviicola sp.]
MKKIILSTLSVALLSLGMVSCGKSTKGKMINDWNVKVYDYSSTYTDDDGDVSTSKYTMTDNALSGSSSYTPSGGSTMTSTYTGTVSENSLSIKKDGTFEMKQNYSQVNSGTTYTTVSSKTGTWSFVGKTKGDDFKKNERVIFNVLTDNESNTTTSGSVSTTSTNADTYESGEYTMVFTVVESKGKELKLEQVGNSSSKQNNDSPSTTVSKVTMELVQK